MKELPNKTENDIVNTINLIADNKMIWLLTSTSLPYTFWKREMSAENRAKIRLKSNKISLIENEIYLYSRFSALYS